MAGLAQNTPLPTNIVVHQRSRELGVDFSDGSAFRFSFEFLRVNSPSAEVQGHSPDQAVLQYGKREVLITEIEQVGNYFRLAQSPLFPGAVHAHAQLFRQQRHSGIRQTGCRGDTLSEEPVVAAGSGGVR